MAQEVKSLADIGGLGLIPELGRFPEEGNGNHSSILAWEIPQTRKPGRLQPKGCKELDATEQLAPTSSMFSNGGRGP